MLGETGGGRQEQGGEGKAEVCRKRQERKGRKKQDEMEK